MAEPRDFCSTPVVLEGRSTASGTLIAPGPSCVLACDNIYLFMF